jgi:hypothetical protein
VNTTIITVVLLQNCIDLQSGKRNEVIHVQMEGASDVIEEENREPTPPLTDPSVGFKAVECLTFNIRMLDISNAAGIPYWPNDRYI